MNDHLVVERKDVQKHQQ